MNWNGRIDNWSTHIVFSRYNGVPRCMKWMRIKSVRFTVSIVVSDGKCTTIYSMLLARLPELRYTWNQGHMNIDNPKLAIRYFLNAIDRVQAVHKQYVHILMDLERKIPGMQQLIDKPFEKSGELQEFKMAHTNLEREILTRLQSQQLLTHATPEETPPDVPEEKFITAQKEKKH